MNKYFQYLKYITRHRWFVFVACMQMRVVWRGLVHDLSKFLPSEFFPYVEQFNGRWGYKWKDFRPDFDRIGGLHLTPLAYNEIRLHNLTKANFDKAWLLHQHRNPHHWQFWILRNDKDGIYPLEMPEVYVREMVADWVGAGLAITGKRETKTWYEKNKDNMVLHSNTRELVEQLLDQV